MRKLQATRTLLVEHDHADARAVTATLSQAAPGFDVVRADRLPDALLTLQRERFGLVLVDAAVLGEEGMDGLDALRILAAGAPLVVLADAGDDGLRAAALEHGASAVLTKGENTPEQIVPTVRSAVGTAAFEHAVKENLRTARRDATDMAVVQVHLEGWAAVTLGRPADELALLSRAVSERLAGRLAPGDTLMDLGAGRFGVIAPDAATERGARAVALELALSLERPVALARQTLTLRPTCGWVVAPSSAATADVAVRDSTPVTGGANPDADADVPAERSGTPGPRRGFARRLRAAIADGELVLHYQPVIRLGDDTIQVVEALVRWRVPTDDGGTRLLPPAEFIPLAEETGAIEEIGAFALREACRQLREWDDAGLSPFRVAVNLSARELCSPELPARVADALAESDLPAERLEVELTESMFADPDETAKMLRRLRAIGVRVAIDDFGTGYSSLGYLTRFAVDAIKIDGAFVRRAAEGDGAEVLRGIVAIAHQLQLEVVAEGVETVEQLHFVQAEEVDLVQGYLFCEPLAADAAGAWLAWAEKLVKAKGRAPMAPTAGLVLGPREKLIRSGTLACGAALGWLAVWPVHQPPASACPPAGEGLVFCQVQHAWAPAFTLFMAIVTVVFLAVEFTRNRLDRSRTTDAPRRVRRGRRWQAPAPAANADPILLAASWGVTASTPGPAIAADLPADG